MSRDDDANHHNLLDLIWLIALFSTDIDIAPDIDIDIDEYDLVHSPISLTKYH